jgi:hypothetical protein
MIVNHQNNRAFRIHRHYHEKKALTLELDYKTGQEDYVHSYYEQPIC